MSLGTSDAICLILFSVVMVFPPRGKKLRLALENAYETRSPKVPCHSPKLQIQHLATTYAQGFWDMLSYRTATGIGEGVQMAGLFAAVGSYFHRKRSFFIGWMVVAYGVGAFFGPRIGAALAEAGNSWRTPSSGLRLWTF